MKYAQVIIDTAAAGGNAADITYDYKIPGELSDVIKPSMRVVVPFGFKNRSQLAFVVSLSDTSEYDENKVKSIIRLADIEPVIPEYLTQTAHFMREEFFCSYSEAIRCVLPFAEKLVRKTTYMLNTEACGFDNLKDSEKNIISILEEKKEASLLYLKGKLNVERDELLNTLAKLIKSGYVISEEEFDFGNKEKREEYISLPDGDNTLDDYLMIIGARAKKQREVISYLFDKKNEIKKSVLIEETKASPAVLNSLYDMHLIEKTYNTAENNNTNGKTGNTDNIKADQALTAAQQKCVDEFKAGNENDKYLLFGVTGSGKTRVFFEFFEEILSRGKQCLLLVPEISLTPQMMKLVSDRFGSDVAIMHSKLTPAERYYQFLKIKKGEAKIVLGARSALFMPFKNLGIIVIDEEHENSYKSSNSPRYDSIEVANEICRLTNANLVLSSATPSIETFLRAQLGEYKLLTLPERINDNVMPEISIADMRLELKHGNRTPISDILRDKIRDRLDKKEQVLLFLNRRGYNTYVFCRSCGHIEMCPNCEVSLTSHISDKTLTCHYCGHKSPIPTICPECGSDKIKFLGSGTEKIETAVREMFADARILRLDGDVAANKNSYERVLSQFSSGDADILIGTQMIVKGLDFDNVTLVGILLADSSLNFPDINSAARTFQLTSQAAGRAGRREKKGEVIMQTYKPENPTLVYCSQHDYEGFYAYDIDFRRKLNYPPFTEILGVFTAHEDLTTCMNDAKTIHERLEAFINSCDYDNIKIYAPAPAFIQKLKNKYIYHVLVKYENGSEAKGEIRSKYNDIKRGLRSYVYAEINPVTLL